MFVSLYFRFCVSFFSISLHLWGAGVLHVVLVVSIINSRMTEKGISCPQFSDWSIFLVGNFEWWKILGRHLLSSGIVTSLFGKNKNLEKWPWMMTSVFFFWKIDRKKFYSEHVLFRQIFDQRGKKS